MSLPVDAWSARLTATLHVFATDKKARAGARWLIHASLEAGVEPRIGPILLTKLPLSASSAPAITAARHEEAEGEQHVASSRKRRKKTGAQAQLRRIIDYYEAELQEAVSTDAVPAAPCPPSPPPEPDLPEYLAHFPPAAPTRTYASAARSPLSEATANARPAPTAPAQCNGPSQEEIRSFVFDTLFANEWDSDLRVRKISLTADAPSFKVKVPRTSRAGVNETLTGEQIAARLVKVMRSRAQPGPTMDAWRKDQIAWLLQPTRPTLGFTGARTAYGFDSQAKSTASRSTG